MKIYFIFIFHYFCGSWKWQNLTLPLSVFDDFSCLFLRHLLRTSSPHWWTLLFTMGDPWGLYISDLAHGRVWVAFMFASGCFAFMDFAFIALGFCPLVPLIFRATMEPINKRGGMLESPHQALETFLQEEKKKTRDGSKVSGRSSRVLPQLRKASSILSYPHHYDCYLG